MTAVDVSSGTAYAGRDANHAFGFHQFAASKHAQYFTPNWLAELLCEALQPLVPPRGPTDLAVLDPTCGSGRLLAPWKRIGATVLGIELDELAADHARFALGTTNVRTGDVLDYRNLVKGFSLVVTNPPFGLWWTPPDAGELWECETSGGKMESQGATLEICTRALAYNGVLVAIIPTSTFQNKKDHALRDTLYANYKGILQVTLPDLFEEEYGIGVSVDLVVARRMRERVAAVHDADPRRRGGGGSPLRLPSRTRRGAVPHAPDRGRFSCSRTLAPLHRHALKHCPCDAEGPQERARRRRDARISR